MQDVDIPESHAKYYTKRYTKIHGKPRLLRIFSSCAIAHKECGCGYRTCNRASPHRQGGVIHPGKVGEPPEFVLVHFFHYYTVTCIGRWISY